MKNRGIQRSVRASKISRSPGDAPNIGRVARVPGTGMPKGERRIRKRGERRSRAAGIYRREVVMAWSILIFSAAFLVLGFSVWSWVNGLMGREVTAGSAEPTIERYKVSEFESPSQEEAVALVKMALKARDPLQVMAYFRAGETGPETIIRFLAGMEDRYGPIRDCQWLSSMDANGLLLEGVLVASELDGKPHKRLALLTPDEAGVWKIDYDAFARVTQPSWEAILDGDGQGMARVILSNDAYYNGPFRDDSRWSCYGMASPDIEPILIGYCRKGSPQDEAMQRMLRSEPDQAEPGVAGQSHVIRATLQLARPPSAEKRQFEITRVLAEDWVLSDEPFDRAGD